MRGRICRSLLSTALLLFWVSLPSCTKPKSDKVQGYIEGEFIYIASPLAGALQKLHVQPGDQVKQGDPLFELEDTSEKVARDQARAALKLSKEEFKRQERLFQSGASAAPGIRSGPRGARSGS